MGITIPTDKELFPRLDPNRISSYAHPYRKAVKENLSRLTSLTSKNILKYGWAGAERSGAFCDGWFPTERHRSKELSEAEKQFNSAILDGSIDGFPSISDLWISNGDVLHTYSVSGNRFKAQIYYGNGRVGPDIRDYLTHFDNVSEEGEYLNDFSYEFSHSDVIKGFPAFRAASSYLQAKKQKEAADKSPGFSPPVLLIFILLTALGAYWQYFNLPDFLFRHLLFLPGLMMVVFGLPSIIGIWMMLAHLKPSDNTVKIGSTTYVISPAEEARLKKAMDDEYMQDYRQYRYLKLWKKYIDEYPNTYPVITDCSGHNVIPQKLQALDRWIESMESDFRMYQTFPSTAEVKRVDY